MNLYPDYSQIIYRYINNKLIGKVYQGEELTYKFIETYSQNLPIKFKSLFFNYLLNYKIYGTSMGAGVETENLWDGNITAAWIGLDGVFNYDQNSSSIIIECDPESNYAVKKFSETNRFRVVSYASFPNQAMQGTVLYSNDQTNEATVTTPANAKYLAVYINSTYSSNEKVTIIFGSSPPTSYIPPGYKIPILNTSGVTKNLYVVDETTRNDYISLGFYGEWRYSPSYAAAITIRLPCKSNTRYTISVDDISSITIWRVSLINTDNIPDESVTSIPVNSIITQLPQSGSNSFTTNSDSKYILFQLDKSLYDTKKIMLVEGSTAPEHYIPHRYTSDIPIYIGSSKLGEEEYVDFGEQKVYKRTENLFDGEWQVGYWALSDGQHRNSTHWVCSLNKFPCVAGSAYSFKYFDNSRYYSIGWYDSNDTYISMDSEQNSDDTGYRTFTAIAPNNAAYIAISIGSYPGEYDLIDPSTAATLTLVEGSTAPSSYIPYLQPTDPPVEFPSIPTYKNENTLSTNISLGEVTIKGRIESITPPESIIYGYHINPNESDPSACVTYIEDAIGKNPASMGTTTFDYGDWQDAFFMPRPCMVKSDGTVDYYLNPNDYTKKEDGSDSDISNINYQGNAMMQWPKIYWKYESGQTEGEGYFYVSNIQVDNSYKCWCNIDSKNNEIDYFYTAIYNGTSAPNYDNTATYNIGDYVTYTDTTYINGALYQCNTAITIAEEFDSTKWTLINASSPLRSLSGIQTNQANGCGYLSGTIQENRALANNTTADTEWYFDVLSDRMLINGLLILMGKSLNTQAVFGNGITSGSEASKNAYVTGSLNNKGLFYGDISDTTTAIKVFGMENWWGHTWHRTAGLIGGANNTYLYKLTYNNYDGSTATYYNSTGTGYLTAISNNTATDIIRPSNSVDDTNVYWYNKASYGKWGYLPIQVGGSSTTYYADYYYNGTGYLLVGGSSSTDVHAGASYFYLPYSFAYEAWSCGAYLSLKPLKQ